MRGLEPTVTWAFRVFRTCKICIVPNGACYAPIQLKRMNANAFLLYVPSRLARLVMNTEQPEYRFHMYTRCHFFSRLTCLFDDGCVVFKEQCTSANETFVRYLQRVRIGLRRLSGLAPSVVCRSLLMVILSHIIQENTSFPE